MIQQLNMVRERGESVCTGARGGLSILCAGRNLRIWPEGLSMCIRSFRKTQDTHCMWNINKVAEATQDGDERAKTKADTRERVNTNSSYEMVFGFLSESALNHITYTNIAFRCHAICFCYLFAQKLTSIIPILRAYSCPAQKSILSQLYVLWYSY